MAARGVALLLCYVSAASAAFVSGGWGRSHVQQCHPRRCAVVAATASPDILQPPTGEESAALANAMPSPALQPREVITFMLHALHRNNIDSPTPRFGCEVALRFLAPSNPASRADPQQFATWLNQPWYQSLLDWSEYRWEGDPTLLRDSEAYQQVSVRTGPEQPWVSVRWILTRVPFYATSDQWMVEAVFVEEPDGAASEMPLMAPSASDDGDIADAARAAVAAAAMTPQDVVLKVMNAVRNIDEPYPLHGCEVAIRYCSPTNRASQLSPQAFARYLAEPWYKILTEWDEIELEEPEAAEEDNTLSQDVLVRRNGDESWTIVNWRLNRYSGRWLTDALTITG